MNKVGLAVVTYMRNYGSYLQSFATQEVIKSLGYDTEVINIKGVEPIIGEARRKYFMSKIFSASELKSYAVTLKGILKMKTDTIYAKKIKERDTKYDAFRERYTFSPVLNSWEEIGDYCRNNFSSVVVGSDQLWRPANIEGGYYTLEFVPEAVNKVSYSTSFGVKVLPSKQAKKAQYFIPRINHLSVREESGRQLVKALTNLDARVVCDPTMLLTRDDWESYLPQESKWEGQKYILCYFLGQHEKYMEFAKRLGKKTGKKVVGLVHCSGYNSNVDKYMDEMPFDVGPLDFIDLIRNADCVLTDSFHCCVFSILFHKDFFVFRRFSDTDRMSTNDRLSTLFSWTGIKNRLLEGDEVIVDSMLIPIDYSEVDDRIEKMRKESKEFLELALKDGK